MNPDTKKPSESLDSQPAPAPVPTVSDSDAAALQTIESLEVDTTEPINSANGSGDVLFPQSPTVQPVVATNTVTPEILAEPTYSAFDTQKKLKNKILTALVVTICIALLAAAAYFGWQYYQSTQSANETPTQAQPASLEAGKGSLPEDEENSPTTVTE